MAVTLLLKTFHNKKAIGITQQAKTIPMETSSM